MNIIKIEYSKDISNFREDINYIGDRLSQKILTEIWEKYGSGKRWNEILPTGLINDIIEDFNEYYENITTEEIFNGEHDEDIYDFLYHHLPDQDLLKYIIDDEKYSFDTVGYSPWSYVIYDRYYKWEYVRDLWEGWNFYDITLLDEENNWIDSISNCYIVDLDKEDLNKYLKYYFNIDDYYVVDNEVSKWAKDIKKAKEIHDIKYIPCN